MVLPPRVDVPTTPAIQARDIHALYEIHEKDLKGTGAFSRVVTATKRAPLSTATVASTTPTDGAAAAAAAAAPPTMRAIKIMDTAQLVGKKAEMVAHEREILRRTRHPHIITMHECIQTPEHVYFVLDLMEGDLFEYIVKRRRLPEAEVRDVMLQLLSAVAYLHEQSIVHRDIKPENILIQLQQDAKNPTAKPTLHVKLADFGLAKVIEEWDVRSTPCGTSFYIAPEIIRGIESQGARPLVTNKEVVKSVDVWSLGVVFFILLSGRPPFSGQVKTSLERRALLAKIDRGVLFPEASASTSFTWASVSEEARDLIAHMLNQDTRERITAKDALKHVFFKKNQASIPAPAASQPATGGLTGLEAAVQKLSVAEEQEASAAPAPAATTAAAASAPPQAEEGSNDAEERKQLMEAINELQKDIVETGDKEGDETTYQANVINAPTAPVAVNLNAKAKIGPGALKK